MSAQSERLQTIRGMLDIIQVEECDSEDKDGLFDKLESVKRELAELEAAWQARPEPSAEAAFKAGYHCQWDAYQQRYYFDQALKPGDTDGAFAAWLSALGPSPKE